MWRAQGGGEGPAFFVPSGERLAHLIEGTPKALGDGLLGHAVGAPAADALGAGFSGPQQHQGGQEEQGKSPCGDAGDGHGSTRLMPGRVGPEESGAVALDALGEWVPLDW